MNIPIEDRVGLVTTFLMAVFVFFIAGGMTWTATYNGQLIPHGGHAFIFLLSWLTFGVGWVLISKSLQPYTREPNQGGDQSV